MLKNGLTEFSGYKRCVFDSVNTPITKDQVCLRSIKHVI